MRLFTFLLAAAALLPLPEARAQERQPPPPQPPPHGAAYDIVAGDRESAWRINRMTGEVMICRVDTTTALDSVRARCVPAIMEGGEQQQSMTPGSRP